MAKIMIAQHTIADYSKWRQIFDSAEELRMNAGIYDPVVMRSHDNPLDITIMFRVADVAIVQQFLDSKPIREIIMSAGITSIPNFIYLERVEDL